MNAILHFDARVLGAFQRLSDGLERLFGLTCFRSARIWVFVSTVLNVCQLALVLPSGFKSLESLKTLLLSLVFCWGARKIFLMINQIERLALTAPDVDGKNQQGRDSQMRALRVGFALCSVLNLAIALVASRSVLAVFSLSWLYLSIICYLASCTPLRRQGTD